MLRDVAERFLRDAVEGLRGSRRELLPVGVRLAGDRNPAGLLELGAIGGERRPEPRFLQQAGVQLVREVADVPSDLDEARLYHGDLGLGGGVRWKLMLDRPEIESRGAELLEDAVVQVAGDARALLLLRLPEPALMPLDGPAAAAVEQPQQRPPPPP